MNTLMKIKNPVWNSESGKAGWALAWLLGVPLPVLLVIYAISRC